MASVLSPHDLDVVLPDHTQLPDKDNIPVRNSFEPFQSALLTEALEPVLSRIYPESDWFIGQDTGIYWEKTNPPMAGCKSPDWYLVGEVPHLLNGIMRRSYVMWQELVAPTVILEYASDGGEEERDKTPRTGKFWVYERRIRPAFYGIFFPQPGMIEMYHMVEDRFRPMPANAQGRFPIASLGVELGIWSGKYGAYQMSWMRWWDAQGNLVPTGEERADHERQRAEALAAKLRSLGVDPETV